MSNLLFCKGGFHDGSMSYPGFVKRDVRTVLCVNPVL
jgi:hypothetical protein